MKRIAFFQSDFQVGGIQKALLNLLSQIDYSKCAVDVYYFDTEAFFELPRHENLRLIPCGERPYWYRFIPFDLLRKFAPKMEFDREYDAAVDFSSYRAECALGALEAPAKKRVMWIHNDVALKLKNEPKYRILWYFFKGKFQYFDEFAAVSPGIAGGFREAAGIRDKAVTAVSNHVDAAEILRKAALPSPVAVDPGCYNLCTVGRLCHQKGFDILLELFARVRQRRQDIRLFIIGDGPDRRKLEKQLRRLGLEHSVVLTGNLANPYAAMDQMDGFVLTSRYEGQGIVIREAQVLGLELFLSKNLERYNPGIFGRDDLEQALWAARRREKVRDSLLEYNQQVRGALNQVLGLTQ